jgi:lysozyme
MHPSRRRPRPAIPNVSAHGARPRRRARLAAVALLAACAWAAGAAAQAADAPPAELPADPTAGSPAPPGEGIDVSHHSGEVDWFRVADQGYVFAYVKASEGVDDPDPRFHEHWTQLGALGLPRGAYHFYVSEDDPEEQARLFLSTVELNDDDLLPVVDVEVVGHGTPADWAGELARFLDLLEAEIGVRPMVYSSPNFWDRHLGPDFAADFLWLAEYGVEVPRLPAGRQEWHLWQYAEDREIDGVEKEADVSRLHPSVSLDELRIGHLRAAARRDGPAAGAGDGTEAP